MIRFTSVRPTHHFVLAIKACPPGYYGYYETDKKNDTLFHHNSTNTEAWQHV